MTYSSVLCFCVCLFVLTDSISFTDGSHFILQSGLVDKTGYTILRKQVTLCSQVIKSDLQKQHRFMFDCMTQHIRHCVYDIVNPLKTNVTFCGKLTDVSRPPQTQVHITVLHQHVVLFKFMIFAFYRTIYLCGPDNVQITDVTMNQRHNYCGRRIPWSTLTTGRHGHVLITIHDNLRSTLSLFYSAQHFTHIHSILEETEWKSLNPHLETGFSKLLVAQSIVYCTSPHLITSVEIQWKQQNKLITIYDGPGRRSLSTLKISPSSNSGTYHALSSAYCLYILMEHASINMDETTINFGTQLSQPRKCPYKANPLRKLTVVKIKSSYFQYNYICLKNIYLPSFKNLLFPLLHFVMFTFDGPDTITSLSPGCEYGGVFIQEFGDGTSSFHKSMCRSYRNSVIYTNTTRINIFVIWFQGYNPCTLLLRIHYRSCPTTYVQSLVNSDFNIKRPCRHYVCAASKCKINLIRNNGPVGPVVLRFSPAQNVGTLSTSIAVRAPIMCSSRIHVMYLAVKHWPFERDIYLKRMSFKYTKTSTETITENIVFLYNASASLITCIKSPAGMSIFFPYCGKFSEYLHKAFIFSAQPECSLNIPILQNVTIYSFEVVGVPLHIIVSYMDNCSLRCRGHEIILHEKTLNTIYEYSARLMEVFQWQTHTNQRSLRLRITPPMTCSQSCKVSVFLSMVDTNTQNEHGIKFIPHSNNR